MNATDTRTASEVLASLSIPATKTWDSTEAIIARNGREYRLTVTSARATLTACNSAHGANDGYEVARAYNIPDCSIPAMLAKLPA